MQIRCDSLFVYQVKQVLQKGFFHLFSANCLTQLLGFGSLIIVSKLLLPEEVGAIKIIQAYIAVFLTLAQLGRNSAIIKFCAEIRESSLRMFMLQHTLLLTSALSLGMLVILIIAAQQRWISQDEIVCRWLPLYATIILPNVIYSIFTNYLQAIKQFKKIAVTQSLIKVISVFGVVAGAWFYGLAGYIVAMLFLSFLSASILAFQSRFSFHPIRDCALPRGFSFLAHMSLIGSTIAMLGSYVDLFFLDHFVADREVIGYYALATIFIMIGTQFTGTVQSFLTPYFAERSHDGLWLWNQMKRAQRYLSVGMIFICGGIYLFAYLLVHFYYGDCYVEVLWFLAVLLLQLWLTTTYSLIGTTLMTINKTQYNIITVTIGFVVKSVFAYFLVVNYGIYGLAFAPVMAEIPCIVVEYILVKYAFRTQFGKTFSAS